LENHEPKHVEEDSRLLSQFGGDGKLLAGGHSLLPMMKLRLAAPRHLIDVGRLPDLRYIRETDGRIEIGALTTHFQIESSELLHSKLPLLPEAAREVGDVQVRNRGTLGGSLAHSDPAADWPAVILALDAEIQARGANSARWIPAAEFFIDLLSTALKDDEILTSIRIPTQPARSGHAYLKLHHPASGYAMVGIAVVVTLNDAGDVEQLAVGVTGIGAKAYRAAAVEDALRGKAPDATTLKGACEHAADGIEVNSDLFASADYRRHLAKVYTRRALEKAIERTRASASA
ncbi:MAG: FAD binding domain-containing protein, partial [Terriglobia bacterium]